jgi:hypothetical protein
VQAWHCRRRVCGHFGHLIRGQPGHSARHGLAQSRDSTFSRTVWRLYGGTKGLMMCRAQRAAAGRSRKRVNRGTVPRRKNMVLGCGMHAGSWCERMCVTRSIDARWRGTQHGIGTPNESRKEGQSPAPETQRPMVRSRRRVPMVPIFPSASAQGDALGQRNFLCLRASSFLFKWRVVRGVV